MTTSFEQAVSWLFVPGNRPDRFEKAVISPAHEVVYDLEDAVPPAEKADARLGVSRWFDSGGSGFVRLNGASSEWFEDDVRGLCDKPGLRGFMLPKAESPADVVRLGERTAGLPVIALVETAVGIHRAYDLATVDVPLRLAFGSIDYAGDIGAAGGEALLLARSTLVQASRVGGRSAPIDGVSTELNDFPSVVAQATVSRNLGFSAKLCIHPAQVPAVHEGFMPAPAEIEWARGVIGSAGHTDGAATRSDDGQMIDRPVVARAQWILALAGGEVLGVEDAARS